ncbi:hypothetical protein PHET_03599 [Paragonimus heterotremus]|uniref:Uncharacterized protein n=1 Tax=Paragonimus heterotremus TaxID=100268 RepID=A0A8J4TJK1_9TREM|nr:hypothetical protein PHET_03599 [Paragonimus heterotremus]
MTLLVKLLLPVYLLLVSLLLGYSNSRRVPDEYQVRRVFKCISAYRSCAETCGSSEKETLDSECNRKCWKTEILCLQNYSRIGLGRLYYDWLDYWD